MENYVGMKLKRKEFEDDFSDFSLSSPALKMRRLNAELPPIIEEEEADIQTGYQPPVPETGISNGFVPQVNSPVIEELPSVPENDERAIVLFKPMSSTIPYYQEKFSVDPNLISCFKNQAFWNNQVNSGRSREDVEAMESENDGEENACRAVIPWVPSLTLNPVLETHASQTEMSEAMDAEEMEASTMEIEDSNATNVSDSNLFRQQPWFQQHCMIPQPPENATTPIVSYR